MPVGDDTNAYRRKLPHLEKLGKTYFVTFATMGRWILPPGARDVTLATCIEAHERVHWLHCAVVMPDHVHLVTTPYEEYRLARILSAIKNASAHGVNRAMNRLGAVWQRESFDRMLRSDEDLMKKCEYVCNNPVRAGLVESANDYPWIWRAWIEGATGGAAEDGGPPLS